MNRDEMIEKATQHVIQPRFSRMMPKRALQGLLKQCRQAGYDVDKSAGIYRVYDGEDLVLRALDGRASYLVMASRAHFDSSYDEAEPTHMEF